MAGLRDPLANHLDGILGPLARCVGETRGHERTDAARRMEVLVRSDLLDARPGTLGRPLRRLLGLRLFISSRLRKQRCSLEHHREKPGIA